MDVNEIKTVESNGLFREFPCAHKRLFIQQKNYIWREMKRLSYTDKKKEENEERTKQ